MTESFATDDELRELLVQRLEVLSGPTFDDVRATARRLRMPLIRALTERARVPPGFLLEQLADAWGVAYTDLRIVDVKPEALVRIPEALARQHQVAAFDREDGLLRVAAANPRDPRLPARLREATRSDCEVLLAPARAIQRAHLLYDPWLRGALTRSAAGTAIPLGGPAGTEVAAPQLVTWILDYAVVSGASDIHIEPYEYEGLVRYRIDGVLQEVFSLTPEIYPTLVARLKILASMRVDERRAPQDGRATAAVGGAELDLRVSSVPTLFGEKIVLRVLSKEPATIDLEALGFTATDYDVMVRTVTRPFGMVLVTGPTGSGKTTTLYATLTRLSAERQGRLNISTIEDPVEQPLPRVSQIALNPAAGIDFAGGLRALLRQDPDVIMVGEIRDRETAEIGVRAALVGRLLLSTLHTNDAPGAIPRLLDLGIERFLLASVLQLVVAQRLARRICTACRETASRDHPAFKAVEQTFMEAVPALQAHGVLPQTADPLSRLRMFRGRGCARCAGTGYRGRIGLFELLQVNDDIRSLILERRGGGPTIREVAIRTGMKTMLEDAIGKVFLGETTIEEAIRATS
jgi:type IV pilus assembly protein PilB